MPAIFDHPLTVADDEIDQLGHVNNLAYIKWMLDAAVAHSAAQGWPTRRYLELGAGWVVRSHAIEYRQPAFAGQQLVVRTWVSNFRKIRSLRKYKIVRPADAALLAVAQTDWTFISFARRVPRRVPPEIQAAFELVEGRDEP